MVHRASLNLLAFCGVDMDVVHDVVTSYVWTVFAWAHAQFFDSRDNLFCVRQDHCCALSTRLPCQCIRIILC